MSEPSKAANTIAFLKSRQAARAAGYPVYLTSDPEWLLDIAICRRAGWAEDPHARHIARPRPDGKIPRFATGDSQAHLRQLADRINRNVRVYRSELGEWGKYLARKLPNRFATHWDA